MSRTPKLPAIPRGGDIARQIAALSEHAEVGSGQRGDPKMRYVTVGELADAGIANASSSRVGGMKLSAPGGGSSTGAPGRQVFAPGDPNFGNKDYTSPPAPTHVQAHGVSRHAIMVTWAPPAYTHHGYSEVFAAAGDASFDDMMAQTTGFDRTRPVSTNNPHPAFLGAARGTMYVQNDIPESAGSTIDEIESPPEHYYWIRFVSTAGVPGPFQTFGSGAAGHVMIDTGALLDAMAAGVKGATIYKNLSAFIGTDTKAVRAAGGVQQYIDQKDGALKERIDTLATSVGSWGLTNQTISEVTRTNAGSLENLWSVRLQQNHAGVRYAAGFGLGITTDAKTGKSSSTFIVDADRFAVMGSSAPAVHVNTLQRLDGYSRRAQITWTAPEIGSGLKAGDKVALSADTATGSALAGMGTIHGKLLSSSESNGSGSGIIEADKTLPVSTITTDVAEKYGLTLTRASSIPFIVDTARGVVGVRGSLIVNGLVRADSGDFDNLSAARAFIQSITANIVNANVLVGQRIVAGIEGGGQITNDAVSTYGSNYVVELNNPVTGRAPFRYYLPRGRDGQPHVAMELAQDGSMNLGGGLSVGKNAVIRTTDDYLVAMGGANSKAEQFALWIGSRSDYEGGNPSQPRGFSEDNGVLWVRGDTGRMGMNATAFLGGDPLVIPSGTGVIDVVPRRDGTLPSVYASAIVNLAPDGTNGNAYLSALHCTLYFVPASFTGPGARVGYLRSSLQSIADSQESFLDAHVGIYSYPPGNLNGGVKVCQTQYDWNKAADIKNVQLQGAAKVPPGSWKVYMVVWPTAADKGPMHAAFDANFFAMQVQR